MKRAAPFLLMVVNDAAFFRSHRWPLALAARDAGWHVEVVAAPDAVLDWIAAQGFAVHPVPFRRKGVHPLGELATLLALWRLYRRLRPDLVHHITIKPIVYGGFVARALGLPAVVHAVTGLGYIFSRRGRLARVAQVITASAYRWALGYRHARAIFQNPDDLRDIWGSRGHDRAIIIPGAGVDPNVFELAEEEDGLPVVLLAARMLWSKGVGDFVDAAALCRAQGLACRFVLVGEHDAGNPEGIPSETLRAWHESGLVEWWGRREDMPAVFNSAHVVVLPSTYREGVPKVLIEAAAAGRALVATDMPGCREIVRHGENGLLVPPRDPCALAEAISRLVVDPRLRQQLGRQGRRLVLNEFSLDHVLRQTLDLYRRSSRSTPLQTCMTRPEDQGAT